MARTADAHRHGHRRFALVRRLLADILAGQFAPGRRLVTEELAVRYGTSHTPVREALNALHGIGVVELVPNRGATVRLLSPRAVRDAYRVRRMLETEAARLACGSVPPADLDRLAADLRRLIANPSGDAEYVAAVKETDGRLHDLVAVACPNRFLAGELERLTFFFRAHRDRAWTDDRGRVLCERLVQESVEHLAVVEALRAGDRAAAGRAMHRHITAAIAYWTYWWRSTKPVRRA